MLLLLRRREQLRYFIFEFLLKGRKVFLGSSTHASDITNTGNLKYSLLFVIMVQIMGQTVSKAAIFNINNGVFHELIDFPSS